MQDNLKLLEEYMKYFGTLKLQLKDNSHKRRRVIVMPLLLRWSFRPGLWTAPLRQHPATTTCGKRGFWNNVLLERESDRLDPSTSQPFASRSKLKQTLETISLWLHIPNSKLHSLSEKATPSAIWGGLAGQKHSEAVWF